ncbi:hypothetical protein MKW94_027356, partial [Papaver nudicaule]|nr:hypothetical protein [Papaver nudicaule]
ERCIIEQNIDASNENTCTRVDISIKNTRFYARYCLNPEPTYLVGSSLSVGLRVRPRAFFFFRRDPREKKKCHERDT